MRLMSFHCKYLLLCFLAVFILSAGCRKKAENPDPVTPVISKISLPLPQLLGLKLNQKAVEIVAQASGDPQVLDAQDLSKTFDITHEAYLESILQLAQAQVQTGNPLSATSLYFGVVPQKFTARCLESSADRCLAAPIAFNCSEALTQKNWSQENYAKLCHILGKLKVYNTQYLAAFFDGDNTLWHEDISDAVLRRGVESQQIRWAPDKAELMNIYPAPDQRQLYTSQNSPYQYYKHLYEMAGPLWNYNFAALAFRGLSLNEAYQIFQDTMTQPYAPIAFDEMVDLLRYLQQQGLVTGVVSASPIFNVIPMVEKLQAGIPLDRIAGLDVMLKNPAEAGSKPISLSRLIAQGRPNPIAGQPDKFKSYAEFLGMYGNWIIADIGPIINARAGKAVQSRAMIRRHVAEVNRQPANLVSKLDVDLMRAFLIAGDNFAPMTDIPNPEGERTQAALEAGNDQGMSEGLNLLENSQDALGGTNFIFLQSFNQDAEGKLNAKGERLQQFENYRKQQELLRPNRIGTTLIQATLSKKEADKTSGGFLKDSPKLDTLTESQANNPASPLNPESAPSPNSAVESLPGSTGTTPKPVQVESAPSGLTPPATTPGAANPKNTLEPLPPAPPPRSDAL